jgi:acyl-CoA reductase-like NAD-dependent aldehyde dehydrogenase
MSAAEPDQYPARKLLIGGQWADSASREQIALINPANEEVFTHVASASEVDVDLAVKSARQAFESMSWRRG